MRSGELQRLVTIEQYTVGSPQVSAIGEPDATWTTFATAWASIKPLRGRELIAAQAVASEVTGSIKLRYIAGLTAAMRVSYGGQIFNILAVVNTDQDDRELILMVNQGPSNG